MLCHPYADRVECHAGAKPQIIEPQLNKSTNRIAYLGALHEELVAFFQTKRVNHVSIEYPNLAKKLPHVRVVHVMDMEWFQSWWNAEDRVSPRIKDVKGRKRVILRYRKRTSVRGIEYWAIREGSKSARILYAVRREPDGDFTYLDTGEGWSLSGIQFVSRRTDGFQPLIPGIIGNRKWRGQNPSMM